MTINYGETVEMLLLGFLFPIGIILILFGSLQFGVSALVASGITYYFKRRRENAIRNTN